MFCVDVEKGYGNPLTLRQKIFPLTLLFDQAPNHDPQPIPHQSIGQSELSCLHGSTPLQQPPLQLFKKGEWLLRLIRETKRAMRTTPFGNGSWWVSPQRAREGMCQHGNRSTRSPIFGGVVYERTWMRRKISKVRVFSEICLPGARAGSVPSLCELAKEEKQKEKEP